MLFVIRALSLLLSYQSKSSRSSANAIQPPEILTTIMWRHFLRMALALVAIATSQMVAAEYSCLMLCETVKMPSLSNAPSKIIECEDKQVGSYCKVGNGF